MNTALGRRLLAESWAPPCWYLRRRRARRGARGGTGPARLRGPRDRRALVRAGDRRGDLHVRHHLGCAHQPRGDGLAGGRAPLPLGGGRPLRGRAARGRARRGGARQRDLRLAGERPQRLRRHDRRSGVHQAQAVVAEGLGTFLLLATIMALAVDRRAPAGFAGLVIGLAVACEIMVIGPISGGSVNPARTFGPYVATRSSAARRRGASSGSTGSARWSAGRSPRWPTT